MRRTLCDRLAPGRPLASHVSRLAPASSPRHTIAPGGGMLAQKAKYGLRALVELALPPG